MAALETFRKRLEAAQQADQKRQNLLEDLIRECEGLSEANSRLSKELEKQKLTEKTWYDKYQLIKQDQEAQNNPEGRFVLVLIDGDNYLFLPSLLKQGENGGRTAANAILERISALVKADQGVKKVVKLFLNMQGWTKFLLSQQLVQDLSQIQAFVRGFRKAARMVDIFDVGDAKNAADRRLEEYYAIHKYHQLCEKIVLGCCQDRDYVEMLEFDQGNALIWNKLLLLTVPNSHQDYLRLPLRRFEIESVFTDQRSLPSQAVTTKLYAAVAESGAPAPPEQPRTKQAVPLENRRPVCLNIAGQRVDEPLAPSSGLLPDGKFCNEYHIGKGCFHPFCSFSHSSLSADQKLTLLHRLRYRLCNRANTCQNHFCFYGHHCPGRGTCALGQSCVFFDHHDKNINIVKRIA